MEERELLEFVQKLDAVLERLEHMRECKELELMEIRIKRAKLEAKLREQRRTLQQLRRVGE